MASSSAPAPIDPRGPRTNQAVLATALVLGLVFRQQWVAPLFAVVLLRGGARVVTIDREHATAPATEDVLEGTVSTPSAGRAPRLPALPAELRSGGPQWVVFSTEYCAVCPSVVAGIEAPPTGESGAVLDVPAQLKR